MIPMKRNTLLLVITACHIMNTACSKEEVTQRMQILYDSIPVSKKVVPIINEASGIADSKKNPGVLWVEEDSGNPTQLQVLGHDGIVKKQIFIKGVENRDWEDICLSDGKIYIGDIGDNAQVYTEYCFYCFNEPLMDEDTIQSAQRIRFNYADGARDAEAFFVDPGTKDIFIITKRDNPSRVYKINYPYSIGTVNIAEQVATLTYSGVVGAAISPDGKEIITKTYIGLQHFTRNANQTITEVFKSKFTALAYKSEPQGEAVGFAINGSGFFTLSEKGFGSVVNLYYYPGK